MMKLTSSDYYFPLSNVAIAYTKNLSKEIKDKINSGILEMATDGSLLDLVKTTGISAGLIEKNEVLQIIK
jgi:hypothetical protein